MATLLVWLALRASTGHAGVPMSLPEGEEADGWAESMALAGLEPGSPGDGAWVRLLSGEERWTLEVRDHGGLVHQVEVPAPASLPDRQGVVWIAASLLETTTLPEPLDEPPPPAPAPRQRPRTPEPQPPPARPVAPDHDWSTDGAGYLAQGARDAMSDRPRSPEDRLTVEVSQHPPPQAEPTAWAELATAAGLRIGWSPDLHLALAAGIEGGAWRGGMRWWHASASRGPGSQRTREQGAELILGLLALKRGRSALALSAGPGLRLPQAVPGEAEPLCGPTVTAAVGLGLPLHLGLLHLEPRLTGRVDLTELQPEDHDSTYAPGSPFEFTAGLAATLSSQPWRSE